MIYTFTDFLVEEEQEGAKLKHIHHAEDRPIFHGQEGFAHAEGALMGAHHHMGQGLQNNKLTMKYDGSPSVVFGHHPETGKFFVASKSAFNKTPKINYTPEDIDKNHGHAPGLAEKLKHALEHLPKVAPQQGVYQGDLMYSGKDVTKNKDGSASFTPNTITYTAKGEKADAIKKSKLGMVIHTQYEGDKLSNMSAHHNVDPEDFGQHPDVYHHTASYDSSGAQYTPESQASFNKHMSAARVINSGPNSKKMYTAISKHGGEAGHLATYINQTVRDGSQPTADGLQKHIADKYQKMVTKLKTEKSQQAKLDELSDHVKHIQKNADHYNNFLQMHGHLQSAKNELVKSLESNEGSYAHAIGGVASKPEGFVYNHTHGGVTEPTKLVNRAEFARQNLLKARPGAAPKDDEKHGVMAYGRMNPPTAGHEQVVNKINEVAKEHKAIHKLVLSHSQDAKKNPLDVDTKVKHARNAFPGTNIEGASKEKPTIMHHASDLYNQGVRHLHVVAGSDRLPEYEKLLKAYNGKEGKHGKYDFKSITLHSAGERDPDSEGVTGVSGTKMRELASGGKKKDFHANLPSKMKIEHKDALYNDLRKAMSPK